MSSKKSGETERLVALFRHCYSLMKEKNISEFRFGKGGMKIFIKRPTAETPVLQPPAGAAGALEKKSVPSAGAKKEFIKSPLAGIFYTSPSPGSPPYVETPCEVKKGQVLCIIEAMKVMNEIESPRDCRVVSVLAKNGELILKDGELFEIE